jgi:RNA polymerase sigma factor (sigma-70 family)
MSMSLAAVACLPLEDRAAFVERSGRTELLATVEALKRAQSPCGEAVTCSRLAWAMAFNMSGPNGGTGTAPAGIRANFLGTRSRRSADRWSPDTSWDVVWAFYVRPHDVRVFESDRDDPGARTLLRELARSVSCEERDDWPWSSQPVDRDLARQCQREVYQLSSTRLTGVLSERLEWWAARDEIVSDTWLQAMNGAWGPHASRRFVGRSLISSWLCAIALNLARNHGRAQARQRRREEPWSDRHANLHLAPEAAAEQSSADEDAASEALARRFHDCINRLREKDRDLIRSLLEGRTPTQIAAIQGKTPAAISQHQQRVVAALQQHFADRQVRSGVTVQKILKSFREHLRSVGYDLFPFLRTGKRRTDGKN